MNFSDSKLGLARCLQCMKRAQTMLTSNPNPFRRTAMKTLMIKDLSRHEALDGKAKAAVRGGMYKDMPKYWSSSYYDESKSDSSLSAFQSIDQSQNVLNNNGNNVAFSDNITSTVKPTQTASNSVVRY